MNFRRIGLWGGAVIILALMVWGLANLASTPTSVTSDGTLSEQVSATDHAEGNRMARVTLVEYSDFQCPACYNFFPVVEDVFTKYSKDILLVYRHFPLPQHDKSTLAAAAAEAAGNQGKFWEMHDLLFQNQPNWSDLSTSDAQKQFTDFAKQLGLNIDKFTTDLHSTSTAAVINNSIESGEKSNVDSTPSFFINGRKITNLQNYGDLDADVAAAIAENK